jgi:hypothetical protein
MHASTKEQSKPSLISLAKSAITLQKELVTKKYGAILPMQMERNSSPAKVVVSLKLPAKAALQVVSSDKRSGGVVKITAAKKFGYNTTHRATKVITTINLERVSPPGGPNATIY